MKKTHLFFRILKETHTIKIWAVFLAFFMVCSLIVWAREPGISTFADAMWYCYAVVTTVGFGDVLVVSHLSRILSVILSVYAVAVIAISTAVIVNFFNQMSEIRRKETLAAFADKLEHLSDLSKEELEEISKKIKDFRDGIKHNR